MHRGLRPPSLHLPRAIVSDNGPHCWLVVTHSLLPSAWPFTVLPFRVVHLDPVTLPLGRGVSGVGMGCARWALWILQPATGTVTCLACRYGNAGISHPCSNLGLSSGLEECSALESTMPVLSVALLLGGPEWAGHEVPSRTFCLGKDGSVLYLSVRESSQSLVQMHLWSGRAGLDPDCAHPRSSSDPRATEPQVTLESSKGLAQLSGGQVRMSDIQSQELTSGWRK